LMSPIIAARLSGLDCRRGLNAKAPLYSEWAFFRVGVHVAPLPNLSPQLPLSTAGARRLSIKLLSYERPLSSATLSA
jgi:hypothetical protein